jgi:hypothetical protein
MEYRIESHLTNVGPLYLFSEDENGNPWAFHGEERERDARTEACGETWEGWATQ